MLPLVGLRPKFRFLSDNQKKDIAAMTRIYREIDRDVAFFKNKSALNCTPGCGECCHRTCVASSVLEMLPAAAFLWSRGQSRFWLKKIDLLDEQAKCVFYSEAVLHNSGHCRIYPFRPLICRLFGFSARESKTRSYELMICRKVKEADAVAVSRAQTLVYKGLRVPISFQYILKTAAVSPLSAQQTMNINIAFAQAVHQIGLRSALAEKQQQNRSEKPMSRAGLGAEPTVVDIDKP